MGVTEVYRYERKFVVTEQMAAAIRDFVGSYLIHDEHMAGTGANGYRVCSLYLDSPSLCLYQQSCNGIKNRYKLRIRFYDECAEGVAFLEIKRRTTETVHKLRAIVTKAAANRLLKDGRVSASDLVGIAPASQRALNEFLERRDQIHAEGVVFVDYYREAFVSKSAEAVRVTFDRNLVARGYTPALGLSIPDESSPALNRGVVLELKYNGRAPRWMHDLITTFNLQRLSYPKYVHCVEALRIGPHRLSQFAGSVAR